MKTIEIEYACARYFGWREHIIVPNISWGMGLHECDLLVMTKSGCAYEVEIKVSLSDLKKDLKKSHGHGLKWPQYYADKFPDVQMNEIFQDKIKYLYFAIPEALEKHVGFIPEKAGILLVGEGLFVRLLRKPQDKSKYRFTDVEIHNIARLGTMRIWTLKNQLRKKEEK